MKNTDRHERNLLKIQWAAKDGASNNDVCMATTRSTAKHAEGERAQFFPGSHRILSSKFPNFV